MTNIDSLQVIENLKSFNSNEQRLLIEIDTFNKVAIEDILNLLCKHDSYIETVSTRFRIINECDAGALSKKVNDESSMEMRVAATIK